MPLTMYGANLFLDKILGSEDPATVYIAAVLDEPEYTMAGGSIEEPIGNSYARVPVSNNEINWPGAADGLKSNGEDIVFPTATGSWGQIRYWAIITASSGGQIICWGRTTPRQVNEGTTLRFARDTLTIQAR